MFACYCLFEKHAKIHNLDGLQKPVSDKFLLLIRACDWWFGLVFDIFVNDFLKQ
jgi:hypothetical protein